MAQKVGNLLIARVSRSSKLRLDVDFVIYKMYKFAGSSAGSRKQCPVNLSRRSRAISLTGLWLPLFCTVLSLGSATALSMCLHAGVFLFLLPTVRAFKRFGSRFF